jgi:flagellar motor switch/type III secretory pathway protein FliN
MPRTLEPRLRPFPWWSVEPLTRADVSALRDVKVWASKHVDLDRLSRVAGELLGVPVTVRIDRARPMRMSRPMDDGVGVVLARAENATIERSALVEAEGSLAAAVVSRALAQAAPSLVKPGVTPSAPVAGAFAAVLIAASRRTHAGNALRVVRAGSAKEVAADLAQLDPERSSVSLTVLVGESAFAARIVVPPDAVLTGARSAWDRRALTALGSAPLALHVVACALCMTAADLASLRPGDALVLPSDPGKLRPLAAGGVASLAGAVWLAAPSAELGLCAKLSEDGRLMLGGTLDPFGGAATPMTADTNDALITALGDVPVVVRVEIGEAVLTAREWASLGRGDVVGLSRRVGGPVVLRVGGIPVARGELVELDGEVAVRIVERLDTKDAEP